LSRAPRSSAREISASASSSGGQAVAAEQEQGAALEPHLQPVDPGLPLAVPASQVTRHLVPSREVPGPHMAEAQPFLLGRGHRVVARELLTSGVAGHVDTGVADVRDVSDAARDMEGRGDTAHPEQLDARVGFGADERVGGGEAARGLEGLEQGGARQLGRVPAGLLAAHAVDHREQAEVRPAEERVLVVGAHGAAVGARGGAQRSARERSGPLVVRTAGLSPLNRAQRGRW
jgi:hypothetical protein